MAEPGEPLLTEDTGGAYEAYRQAVNEFFAPENVARRDEAQKIAQAAPPKQEEFERRTVEAQGRNFVVERRPTGDFLLGEEGAETSGAVSIDLGGFLGEPPSPGALNKMMPTPAGGVFGIPPGFIREEGLKEAAPVLRSPVDGLSKFTINALNKTGVVSDEDLEEFDQFLAATMPKHPTATLMTNIGRGVGQFAAPALALTAALVSAGVPALGAALIADPLVGALASARGEGNILNLIDDLAGNPDDPIINMARDLLAIQGNETQFEEMAKNASAELLTIGVPEGIVRGLISGIKVARKAVKASPEGGTQDELERIVSNFAPVDTAPARTQTTRLTPAENKYFQEMFADANKEELLELAPSLKIENGQLTIEPEDLDGLQEFIDDSITRDGLGSVPPRMRGSQFFQALASTTEDLEKNLSGIRRTELGRLTGDVSRLTNKGVVRRLMRDAVNLANDGFRGRFWYERSGRAIMEIAGGDINEAEKLAQLIAIYSPNASVEANTAFAIEAWNRFKTGRPIIPGEIIATGGKEEVRKAMFAASRAQSKATGQAAGAEFKMVNTSGKKWAAIKFTDATVENINTLDKDIKAHRLLYEGIDFEGRKTNNFYNNIMVEIDPTRAQNVTADLWMARAFGFVEKRVGDTKKYQFINDLTNEVARQLGVRPHQAQAAIWVGAKARFTEVRQAAKDRAVKRKIAEYVVTDTGRQFRVFSGKEDEFASMWRKMALDTDVSEKAVAKAAEDFSDGIEDKLAQVSWETTPGRNLEHMTGIHNAPLDQRLEYFAAMDRALLDESGHDIIAKQLGMLSPREIHGPGYWEGASEPGAQTLVATTRVKGAKAGQADISPSSFEAIQGYAVLRGMLLKQESVGWHRPVFRGALKDHNGIRISFGRTLTADEMTGLADAVEAGGLDPNQVAFITAGDGKGIHLLNFTDLGNREFHSKIRDIVEGFTDQKFTAETFSADSGLIEGAWKNGRPTGYEDRLDASGRSDLLRGVGRDLYARVSAVEEEFAAKYGWQRNEGVDRELRRIFGVPDEEVTISSALGGRGGKRQLPPRILERQQRLGIDTTGATDPEGRNLVARYVAGIRSPGGPNVPLNENEITQVSYALADFIRVVPHEQLRPFEKGRVTSPLGKGVGYMEISDALTGGKFLKTPQEMAEAMRKNPELWTTFFHESGHVIDHSVDFGQGLAKLVDPTRASAPIPVEDIKRIAKGLPPITEKGTAVKKVASIWNEMRELSKIRRGYLWEDDNRIGAVFGEEKIDEIKNYRNSPAELTADAVALYMEDPATAKRLAPHFTKLLRNTVNDEPDLRQIIQFSGFGPLLLPVDDEDVEGGAEEDELKVAQAGTVRRAGQLLRRGSPRGANDPPLTQEELGEIKRSAQAGLSGGALRTIDYTRAFRTPEDVDRVILQMEELFETPITEEIAFNAKAAISEFTADRNKLQKMLDDGLVDDPSIIQQQIDQIDQDLEAMKAGGERTETWVATDIIASKLGLTPDEVLRSPSGRAYNASELRAIRAITEGAIFRLRQLHQRAEITPSDENIVELRRHAAVTAGLTLKFRGARAEAGRALNALKRTDRTDFDKQQDTIIRAAETDDLLKVTGGRKTNELFMKALGEVLRTNDDAALMGFVRKAERANTASMMFEAWINSLLGSPATHVVNTTSNAIIQLVLAEEKWLAATYGALERGLGGSGGVTFREAFAHTTGSLMAIGDAVRAFGRAAHSGRGSDVFNKTDLSHRPQITSANINELKLAKAISPELLEQGGALAHIVDFVGDYYYRLPSRLLVAEDDFFKTIAYNASVKSLAVRDVLERGLKGEAARKRIADIISDPQFHAPQLHVDAVDFARYSTLTSPPGELAASLSNFRQRANIGMWPVGRVIVPFFNVINNIVKFPLQRIPLLTAGSTDGSIKAPVVGALKELINADPARRQTVLARWTSGGGLMALFGAMAMEGKITGRMTDHPGRMEAIRQQGKDRYSFVIKWSIIDPENKYKGIFHDGGDKFYSYNRGQPVGTFLAIAADAATALSYTTDPDERESIALAAMSAIVPYMSDQSFMKGVSELYRGFTPEYAYGEGRIEALGRYLARLGSTFPGAVLGPLAPGSPLSGAIAREVDSTRRDTRPDPTQSVEVRAFYRLVNEIFAKTPGLSETLTPWMNIFAEEQHFEGGLGPDMVSPVYTRSLKYKASDLKAAGLPERVWKNLNFVGLRVGEDLTFEEHRKFVEIVGPYGELERLGMPTRMPARHIRGVDITNEQWVELVRLAAGVDPTGPNRTPLKESLMSLMTDRSYARKPDDTDALDSKADHITNIINGYRDRARKEMLRRHPDLADKIRNIELGIER